jgi:transcriptional repressor NrdR
MAGSVSVKCPFCQYRDSRVLDSRTSDEDSVVRRRRECPECTRRFTTYERPTEVRIFVVKKDGRREPFDREKVVAGLAKARDQLAEEISTSDVGAWVMDSLRAMDEVAYVRFASVHKEFRSTDSFLKEIESLVRNASAPKGEGRPQQTTLFDSQE